MGQRDQLADQVRSASWHPHVGQDECRAVLAGGRHGVVAGGRLPHDAEVRLLSQQPGQGGHDPGVVIGDDDGDLASDWGHQEHARLRRDRCRDASAGPV
jgi:hypothetical protein